MIDFRARAEELLEEFNQCVRAHPKGNAAEVQLEKDECGKWAYHLATQRSWGTDNEVAEACYQLEWRLNRLKEKLVFEILKHGTV